MFGTLGLGCAGRGPEGIDVPEAGRAEDVPVPPPRDAAARRTRRPSPTIGALAVEQDGALLPSVDHAVHAGRRPFTIVVRILGGSKAALLGGPEVGVYVNASFDPHTYDVLASGGPAPTADGEAYGGGSAMAEASPIEPTLFLTSDASHYWYWNSDTDGRCARITREGDDLLCRRDIEKLYDVAGAGADEPISSTSAAALYVVSFQRGVDGPPGYLKLVFDR